ncbi:Ribosomal protein S18 acetylase RimI [Nonomuraea maritima]|uniref:Ribosomal protein S18 acetylase RimI n=1 Tax=Nonomuraea maritima TaxID=683260 RepID=A0A1G9DJJ3_9ACTN|nr:GNAT family N-acetyltransferase [Nonomuraea maritima]SDK64019.1 Ribosomal protein S18 acetylase RimI [Nonomuraea maritima]
MEIRPRTPADLDACVEALAAVQVADRYPVDWPDDPARWLTPDGVTGAWIAVEDASVLGHVAVTHDGEITRLYVAPSARGCGLATRLLDTVASAVRGPLRLQVSSEGTAAIACYERAGWRRTGSTRATWHNAAGEPALLHHYVSPSPVVSRTPQGSEC